MCKYTLTVCHHRLWRLSTLCTAHEYQGGQYRVGNGSTGQTEGRDRASQKQEGGWPGTSNLRQMLTTLDHPNIPPLSPWTWASYRAGAGEQEGAYRGIQFPLTPPKHPTKLCSAPWFGVVADYGRGKDWLCCAVQAEGKASISSKFYATSKLKRLQVQYLVRRYGENEAGLSCSENAGMEPPIIQRRKDKSRITFR